MGGGGGAGGGVGAGAGGECEERGGRGVGVAVLPPVAVAREVETQGVRRWNMKVGPPMYQSIVAYRRVDSGKPEGIVAAFLELLAAGP